MEAIKHHQGTMNKFSQSIFLKKATVVSVSIFSLIFSYSFSSYAIQIAHNVDKSYMFLLCNGILVLIVKNSAGLIGTSQHESHDDLLIEKKTKSSEDKPSLIVSKEAVTEVEEEVAQETAPEEQEHEVVIIATDDDQDHDQEIEELNKKCDDFIRKMKEEIKFGHQQLSMVRCNCSL